MRDLLCEIWSHISLGLVNCLSDLWCERIRKYVMQCEAPLAAILGQEENMSEILRVQRGRCALVHLALHGVLHTVCTQFLADRAYCVKRKVSYRTDVILPHRAEERVHPISRSESSHFLLHERVISPVWVEWLPVLKHFVKFRLIF
jgi:hypothetical protein